MKQFLLCSVLVSPFTSAQAVSTPAPAAPALDRTGLAWTLPFAAAQARAQAEQRLIFVPLIAGGTDKTGCW